MILVRADLNNAGVNITDFAMESAEHINVGLGAASLVEECTCPKEYEGLSCQVRHCPEPINNGLFDLVSVNRYSLMVLYFFRNALMDSYARRLDHGSATVSEKNVHQAHMATHPVAYLASSVLVHSPTVKIDLLGHVP